MSIVPLVSMGMQSFIVPTLKLPPASKLAQRNSSLGNLQRLPPELISKVLDNLDICSFHRFARVTFLANAFVQLQSSYTQLLESAPKALQALVQVGLISQYSLGQLYAILRTEQCTTCDQFGPFLFPLTGKRCCYGCFLGHPSLGVYPPERAKERFGLTEESIRQLPTLRVIPSQCAARKHKSRDLANRLHGAVGNPYLASEDLFTGIRYIYEGPWVNEKDKEDGLFSMACIPFPSRSKEGVLESGLWCRGCVVKSLQFESGLLSDEFFDALLKTVFLPLRAIRRAYTTKSFVCHANFCDGVRRIRATFDPTVDYDPSPAHQDALDHKAAFSDI
ncbi:F-box domain-containing protein [Nemania diffusa]|nr:F-box domain-containing protein [Nemania diffusa]